MKITGRVVVTAANRIQQLPAPFLSELEGLARAVTRHGKEISDLGRYAIRVESPLDQMDIPLGVSIDIRKTFSEFLSREYRTSIDPDKEILMLAGARTGLLLIGAYFVESGTICYLPDPGYDAYRKLTVLFDGVQKFYPLYQRNDYLPNLEQFDGKVSKSLRLLFINSPHNPTGAVCDQGFYQRLQRLASDSNILVVIDSSYALACAGNFRPPLFCELTKRLRVGVEIFSFSPSLCAPELKLTAIVGRKALIEPLAALAQSLGCLPDKPLLDYAAGFFRSAAALKDRLEICRAEINSRTNVIVDALKGSGIEYHPVTGTGFVWVKIKPGRISLNFARGLLRHKGVLVAPGSVFGEEGEGWVRIAANLSGDKLHGALESFLRHYQPIRSRLKRRTP